MIEYIELGPVPSGEDCEQVGDRFDRIKAIRECNAYRSQLYRAFPELVNHDRVRLVIRMQCHDFGSYPEVAVRFSYEDEEDIDLAYRIDSDAPEYWDDEAKVELGLIPS